MIDNDPRWPVTYYIYAYLAPDGEVLYVGQTCDVRTRRTRHRATHWWTPDLEWALIATASTRAESRAAEAAAIREHRPAHNYQHNAKYRRAA